MPGTWSQLKEKMFANKGVKALSLVLAIAAWYAIQGGTNFEGTITDVPIKVYLPEGWSVLDRSADTVDVRFRGTREDIAYLNKDRVSVFIDLRNDPFKGVREIPLTVRQVEAPANARALSVRPTDLRLTLDRESEKNIAVKAEWTGKPAHGMEVEKVVCRPTFTTVRGPQKKLEALQTLQTRRIDIDGRTESFSERVSVDISKHDWITTLSPREVEVDVELIRQDVLRQTLDLPVRILTAAGRPWTFAVEPVSARVILEGAPDVMARIEREPVSLYVDCSRISDPAAYELPILAHASRELYIVEIDPPAAKVTVSDQPE